MLNAENIVKSYTIPGQQTITILRGVDISVEPGEMVTIIGASGSGKTTLLNMLGTLDTPDSGSITIDRQPVFSDGRFILNPKQLAELRNRTIGFVFQFHHLLADFTAAENVAMAEFIATGQLKPARERAAELLQSLGLEHRLNHLPSELSGGEQQRVAIARALMNKPGIVLADEPSGNLDSRNSRILYDLIATLCKEHRTAFIIVTHNEEYAATADRCLRMEDGLLCSN
ncbi:ABC transporter ATP-binding protein [Prosthecochloris sp. N3]|uniref:ABC transporter ATP-binding protein n=1 Tax=Prosthecochloris ethylica TaxID=2743976 RepID=A0ABR9XSU4_9CHLB|nr:ABC transporter ATP-binding protein [Prosthecochloris ethylica]MBF0585582.1 ABC transporter ATP-binding protein [Prosthecochloris ethylica]MBF0637125.1 ABC transporter ATP-binding protein [Prosthecochloris ethylica]MEC9487270.1 ABC transporter ATP-binding protein [Prosthecochloris sp.]NUK46812.1 ABC transporter ATP-binding protein [Prosthecochloris ethylica]